MALHGLIPIWVVVDHSLAVTIGCVSCLNSYDGYFGSVLCCRRNWFQIFKAEDHRCRCFWKDKESQNIRSSGKNELDIDKMYTKTVDRWDDITGRWASMGSSSFAEIHGSAISLLPRVYSGIINSQRRFLVSGSSSVLCGSSIAWKLCCQLTNFRLSTLWPCISNLNRFLVLEDRFSQSQRRVVSPARGSTQIDHSIITLRAYTATPSCLYVISVNAFGASLLTQQTLTCATEGPVSCLMRQYRAWLSQS